jgi:hypothetical protein
VKTSALRGGPGIRNYLERGGHGVLVFDIDRAHAFVRRIPAKGLAQDGEADERKGSRGEMQRPRRLYVSTLTSLTRST